MTDLPKKQPTPPPVMLVQKLKAVDYRIHTYLKFRQGKKSECWPAVRKIKTDLDIALGAVSPAIDRLEAAGLIQVIKDPARKKATRYKSYSTLLLRYLP